MTPENVIPITEEIGERMENVDVDGLNWLSQEIQTQKKLLAKHPNDPVYQQRLAETEKALRTQIGETILFAKVMTILTSPHEGS
ncbi:MAG: hypothetical protein ABII08_03005 [Candidatus Beckwithbacteria bacterium]